MKTDELEAEIIKTGDLIKAGKARKETKEQLAPLVSQLLELKAKLKEMQIGEKTFDRAALESLLLKRFFLAPSFEIYGGVAGLFDYGPPGCALQNNVLSLWRQHFVLEEDMLEVECTNLTPEDVLKTSGHVERFADYMVKDSKTGDIFRADHLVKAVLKGRIDDDAAIRLGRGVPKKPAGVKAAETITPEKKAEYELILETLDNYVGDALGKLIKDLDVRNPDTGNSVTDPVLFNLMFDTQIGPTGQFKGYLRPETAQGHFLNFKRLLDSNNEQMPFASASIGKSFRNEISPRQGLLRVREFTMCEIEHYVHPDKKNHPRFSEVKDVVLPLYSKEAQLAAAGPSNITIGAAVASGMVNNETLGYFIARIYLFLLKIGIHADKIRFRQHMDNEMAHYASDCWDAEIKSSYGWIESVGCADRSAYDLTAHTKRTGQKLIARETIPERVVQALELVINKSKFGPVFAKNAKFVQGALAGITDEAELKKLQGQLAADGKFQITGTDGNVYEVTSAMASVEMKTKKINVLEYTPNVIEPSFGIGRILYALLEHSYYVREGDEQRAVFQFPAAVAPTKALVVPLSKNAEFEPFVKDIVTRLRKKGISNKVDSSSGSIGRRYARNDEVGTPFGITIDFDTVKDSTVTLRERDSTKQIRASPQQIVDAVDDLVEGRTTWEALVAKYGEFAGPAQ
ncbi:Glycine--tRNA ligase 1, mitochondrial [Kappamyces sp. JEL0680]|nr:Glycine--tRNA ligase 1, mitochondrial [Kappamyces sp. JEL0680]